MATRKTTASVARIPNNQSINQSIAEWWTVTSEEAEHQRMKRDRKKNSIFSEFFYLIVKSAKLAVAEWEVEQ